MIKRVYIDTSVVGGYFDDEFSADTIPFFDAVRQGLFTIVASDLLDAELLKAPAFVKDLMKGMPMQSVEKALLSPEAMELADHYIRRGGGKDKQGRLPTYCHCHTLQGGCPHQLELQAHSEPRQDTWIQRH